MMHKPIKKSRHMTSTHNLSEDRPTTSSVSFIFEFTVATCSWTFSTRSLRSSSMMPCFVISSANRDKSNFLIRGVVVYLWHHGFVRQIRKDK